MQTIYAILTGSFKVMTMDALASSCPNARTLIYRNRQDHDTLASLAFFKYMRFRGSTGGRCSFLQKHKNPCCRHTHRAIDQGENPKSVQLRYSSLPSYVPLGFLKTVRQYSTPQKLF